jgi:uncharacterized phage-like protein YoqJ
VTSWPAVMVTGHRPQHLRPDVRPWVRSELVRLALKLRNEHGTTVGISGMAIGADLWWAATAVKAGLTLHAHVPFPQQPDKWRDEDKAEWQRLLGLAAHTETYGAGFSVRLLHARNDGMIRACDLAIAVHDPRKTEGGTASAVRKLLALGRPVVHVDPWARMTTLRRAERWAA